MVCVCVCSKESKGNWLRLARCDYFSLLFPRFCSQCVTHCFKTLGCDSSCNVISLSESMQWRICPDVSQGHPGDLFCNLNMNRSKPDQANLLPALSHPVIYLLKRVYR